MKRQRSMFQKPHPGAFPGCRYCDGVGCLACPGERERAERQRPGKKRHYADRFGLPEGQIRYFDELSPTQVEDVRRLFTAGLVNVEGYVYAVKHDGRLVSRRERRNPLLEPPE